MSNLEWSNDDYCTGSYEEWCTKRDDALQFLELTSKWSQSGYNDLRRAARKTADGSGRDVQEVLLELSSVSPSEYEFMLCSTIIQQLVTAFDIYHEEAIQELGGYRGFQIVPENEYHDSLSWRQVNDFFKVIGVDISSERAGRIRRLRHRLAHQAGWLERRQDQVDHGNGYVSFVGQQAKLSPQQVRDIAAELNQEIERVDVVTWSLAYNENYRGPEQARLQSFLATIDRREK